MREDGFIIDKVVLSSLDTYDPTSTGAEGPPESTLAPN